MSDLPPRRLEVDPLPPPPGAFDQVLQRATERRHRRTLGALGVVTVFLAGVSGGASLDSGVRTVPAAILDYAAEVTNRATTPAPEPRRESRTAASGTPDLAVGSAVPRTGAAGTKAAAPPAEPSAEPEEREEDATASTLAGPPTEPTRSPRQLRLVAVDVEGQPVAGLFVYPAAGGETWVPAAEPVGRTAADGTFTGACPQTAVLLAPWPLHEPAGAEAAAAPWAATFVGGATQAASAIEAPCTRSEPTTVVLQPGSALTGTLEVPSGCEAGPLTVRVHGVQETSVTLEGFRDGDPVRVGGLPSGRHTVVLGQRTTEVVLGGGADTPVDLTYGCDPVEPSPSPSSTPSVSPSPAPSTTAEPTSRPGTTPTPTATSSPSAGPESRKTG